MTPPLTPTERESIELWWGSDVPDRNDDDHDALATTVEAIATARVEAFRAAAVAAIEATPSPGEFTYREGYGDGLDHAARIVADLTPDSALRPQPPP